MNLNKLLRDTVCVEKAVADRCFRLLDDPELVRGLAARGREAVALYRELLR